MNSNIEIIRFYYVIYLKEAMELVRLKRQAGHEVLFTNDERACPACRYTADVAKIIKILEKLKDFGRGFHPDWETNGSILVKKIQFFNRDKRQTIIKLCHPGPPVLLNGNPVDIYMLIIRNCRIAYDRHFLYCFIRTIIFFSVLKE